MEAQEIFDKVKKHLLKQEVKSVNKEGACGYRGLNGRVCAIGCLIPDSLYDENMENLSIWNETCIEATLLGQNRELADLLGIENGPLLRELQVVHDNYHPSSWEKALDGLKLHYKLS